MKIRCLLILFSLIALGPQHLLANKILFPQVVFGGGYTTEFVMVNTGTTTVSSQVVFFGQDGGPRPDLTTPIVVGPGATKHFTFPDAGPLTIVWGELDAGAGTIEGVATFALRSNGVLTTTVGVLGSTARNSFLIPVEVTPTASTGVAIANLNGVAPVNVTLRLIGENGGPVATAVLPMGPRGQAAAFVHEIFPQLSGTTFRGTLVIEDAGGGANVTATALTLKEGIYSSIPVLPGDGTGGTSSLYFPHVPFGGGYSTTFAIINTSTEAIAGTLTFYDQQGNSRSDLNAAVNIPQGGSQRMTIPDVGPLTVIWGELILPSGEVQGVATFDRREGGALVATVGVLGVAPGTSIVVPADLNTGVAVANLSDAPANVTLRLRTTDGQNFATTSEAAFSPMAPRSQVARFVPELFPQVAGTAFTGTLVIEQATAVAPFLGVTALTTIEGIFSSLPVIPGGGDGGGGGGNGGGGGGSPGLASECLNPSIFTSASTEHLEYLLTDGTDSLTQVWDYVYTPNSTFQGQSATERSGTTTTTVQGIEITTTTTFYSRLEGSEIVDFGSIVEQTFPFASTTTVYNPPRRDDRFTLDVNESTTISSTATITTTSPPPLPSSMQTVSTTETVTYLGRESITVPAGTFDTCKFDQDGSETYWFNVGNGVLIRGVASDGAMELISGTRNGQPIQ